MTAAEDALDSLNRNRQKTFILVPIAERWALKLAWKWVEKLIVAAVVRERAKLWAEFRAVPITAANYGEAIDQAVALLSKLKAAGPGATPLPEVTLDGG